MAAWDPGRVRSESKLAALARLVRVEHTLFSLPFAYAGALLSGHPFTLRDALLIALAVLGLRTAGMAYNNIADLPIDRLNPRSRGRPLVTGAVSVREAYALVALGSLLYYASAALLNRWALLLSPILWVAALTYPYAKRLHSLPHLHLGLVLGLVVFGGAIAASGDELSSLRDVLASVPWLMVAGVTLWVAGFDTVYAILDIDFDRTHDIGSLPARLGEKRALRTAIAMHTLATVLLALEVLTRLGPDPVALASVAIAGALMLYSDLLALEDRTMIPRAFNMNLAVGLVIALGLIAGSLA